MSTLRRIAPGLLLLVLAPLVAEFLLGDFSITSLALLLLFIPQYGGGALLVRELARRTGRGWPTILLLALAYGLIEEGFTTQSLFNPDYVGARLLDYGFVPQLGTSPNWAVFVLGIHVVWSISTPILIAEGIAGERRTTPWLGRIGLGVVAALFVLGCVLITFGTVNQNSFVAPVPEFAAVAVLAALCAVAAFALFRGRRVAMSDVAAPHPVLVGVVALALASLFQLARHYGQGLGLPAPVGVVGLVVPALIAIVLFGWWSRGAGWGPAHYLAIATGTVLTYGWISISTFVTKGSTNIGGHTGPVEIAGQAVLLAVVLALIGWGAARSRGRASLAARP